MGGNWIVFRTAGNLSCDFSDKHQIKPASCTAPESSQQPQLWLEASTPLDQPPQLSSPVQSKPLQFKETSTPLLNSLVPELLPLALLVQELESEPFFGSLIIGYARNPSLKQQLFSYAILGFALSEAMGLFCLMVAFLILFAL